jgi:hypothetical protein
MEASEGSVRAVVDSLEKVLNAFAHAGVELIVDGAPSAGLGRGVRLIERLKKWQRPDETRIGAADLEGGLVPPGR